MRRAMIFALALMPLAGTVQADPVDDAIKARQAYFQLLGDNTGALAAMAKGEVDYDAAVATARAQNLSLLAGYNLGFSFPPGSAKSDRAGKTRALAAIWEDMDDFMAKVKGFEEAVKLVEAQAGEGRAELGGAVAELGKSCKACHDDYRAKDF